MAAVTGVMIVTTLLLVIDLLTRTVSAAPSQASSSPQVSDENLEAMRAKRDGLNAQLAQTLSEESGTEVVADSQLHALHKQLQRMAHERADLQDSWEQVRVVLETLKRQGDQLDTKADLLAREVAEVRARTAVALNRQQVTRLGGQASGKRTWLVRVGAGAMQVGSLETNEKQGGLGPGSQSPSPPDVDALLIWSRSLTPESDALVLLVEPDGVEQFQLLQTALRGRGFDVGWDLVVPEKQGETP